MDAGTVPLAAGGIVGLLALVLLHKWLEKNRGEGFSPREPGLAKAGFIFSMGITAFAMTFVGFAIEETGVIGLVLGCIAGFALVFIGTFAVGTQLTGHAEISRRALAAFVGILYLGIAAIGIISGAALQGSGGFVPAKSDFLLWLAVVLAAMASGIGYIYEAVQKK